MFELNKNIPAISSRIAKGEKGITLLEVLFSVVIIGIVVVGYIATLGTSVSTNDIVSDANTVAALAFSEVEGLRSTEFGKVPFVQTSKPGALKEVPNYLDNILQDIEGVKIITTDDLMNYPREAGADGKRSDDTTLKWVAQRNLLTNGVSEGPDASGPENDDNPGGGGTGDEGPGGSGPEELPEGYQYWMVDLGAQYKISRILYDNRFNTFESDLPDLDEKVHNDDVWQKNWRFFFKEGELQLGEPFDPRYQGETLVHYFTGGYGATGVNVVWDDFQHPLYAGLLGVTEIDTYSDFDPGFHWPYVSEVEVYGFSYATEYIPEYTDAKTGEKTYSNIIIYFPNYKNSGFDMGRRSYIPAAATDFNEGGRQDLIRVQIEFYPYDRRRNTNDWMRTTWWRDNDSELSRYTTSFYRDRDVFRDNLPLLTDLPEHTVYYDNEDFYVDYTVPDATAIRFFFTEFNLPDDGSDYIQFLDKEGNIYGDLTYYGQDFNPAVNKLYGRFGPWVDGDTIVIHFHSDGAEDSEYPWEYGGFKAGRVEVRKPSPF